MAKCLWLIYILPLMLIGPCGFGGEPTEVTFTHYGHACFLITTSNQTRILTDPMKLEGYNISDTVKPDVVTVSHRHIDHDNVAAVAGEPIVSMASTDR